MAAGLFARERGVAGVDVRGHGHVEGVVVGEWNMVDAVILDRDSAGLDDRVARLAEGVGRTG